MSGHENSDAVMDPDAEFDASHIARVYDYLLGGKDNFAADRVVADQIIAQLPAIRPGTRPGFPSVGWARPEN